MKKTFLTFALTVAGLSNTFAFQGQRSSSQTFEVKLTNLTKGQPITPAVLAVHKKSFKLFQLGSPASQGILEIAEDAKTETLLNELSGNQSVLKSKVVTDAPLLPGQSATFKVTIPRKAKVSLTAMLAKTNDAIVALKGVSPKIRVGKKKSYRLAVYDAGTEANNELSAYIPAFGNVGVRTQDSEGFVHPHSGIFGNGDLTNNDDFSPSFAAKITFKRIK